MHARCAIPCPSSKSSLVAYNGHYTSIKCQLNWYMAVRGCGRDKKGKNRDTMSRFFYFQGLLYKNIQ
jgi:hypothetical protein